MRRRAKFRGDRSNRCRDMAIVRLLRFAVRLFGTLDHLYEENVMVIITSGQSNLT